MSKDNLWDRVDELEEENAKLKKEVERVKAIARSTTTERCVKAEDENARLREIVASTTHERVVKAEEDVKKWREAAIDAGKLIKRGIHLMPPDRFRFNEWPGAVQWVEWIEQETGPESGKPN